MTATAQNLRLAVGRYASAVADAAAVQIASTAQRTAPVRTGALRRSIRVSRRTEAATFVTRTVEATEPYASFTDTGTRPHPIYPRRPGGLLVFYWPKVGRVVFLRHVNHPGTKGTRWWTNATNDLAWGNAVRAAARLIGVRS